MANPGWRVTYHVEGVIAFSEYYVILAYTLLNPIVTGLTQWALVAREFTLGASAVVGVAADTTDIIVGHVPAPRGDGVPFSYRDLHCGLLVVVAMVSRCFGAIAGGRKTNTSRASLAD
jgi:hypothetical protein